MQNYEPPTYLSSASVRARYGVSDMSLWRWGRDDSLKFPAPLRINGRKFWKLSTLERWEASRTETEEGANVHASAAS